MLIVVSPKAEMELGFNHWFSRVATIAKAGGLSILFFAEDDTIAELKKLNIQSASPVLAVYNSFSNWEDFLILSRELKQNDFFVIISSRKEHSSYNEYLEKLPYYLSKYFTNNSFIILYPHQVSIEVKREEKEHDHFLLEAWADNLEAVKKGGSYLSRIFKKKK